MRHQSRSPHHALSGAALADRIRQRLSLADFAGHEAAHRYLDPTPEQIRDIEDTQRTQGVHAETVHAALQVAGIATHRFSSVPVLGPGGTLVVDHEQLAFLDTLNTDRLLLQSDITLDDLTGASHWVAFRRDGEQWVLLDSLHSEPRYAVSPSHYLRTENASHFTAFWPQNRLVAAEPAAAVAYTSLAAKDHWRGQRSIEFEVHLKAWNAEADQTNSGGALLQQLSALCDTELAQGRGTEVEGSGGRVFEFTVTLPGMTTSMTVWRGLDGNGVPNLRLAPSPDNASARAALLSQMQAAANMVAGRLRK